MEVGKTGRAEVKKIRRAERAEAEHMGCIADRDGWIKSGRAALFQDVAHSRFHDHFRKKWQA
jgi:hypothetical protein